MAQDSNGTGGQTVIDVDGLQTLLDRLVDRGYALVGPTVRGGAVVPGPIRSVHDLPAGVGDEQSAGRYRLTEGGRGLFGYAAAAVSWKPYLFPPSRLLWRGEPTSVRVDGADVSTPVPQAPAAPAPRQALIGVRACDLHAVQVQDQVFLSRTYVDPDYAQRRGNLFVVAVGCAHPGSTCFCSSMGTGPQVGAGADVALVELLDDGPHRFLAETGSQLGEQVLAEVPGRAATDADLDAARSVGAQAAEAMTRHAGVDTTGLRDLLYANADHPRWAQVAQRCLACSSCTMVCPTCFCVTAVDSSDLGRAPERLTVWDSCFSAGHSELGGRPVRSTTSARYRQWLTHKFASWVDQFGSSGCVGCGRCVTWCPAAIDIREELAAIRTAPGAPDVEEAHP